MQMKRDAQINTQIWRSQLSDVDAGVVRWRKTNSVAHPFQALANINENLIRNGGFVSKRSARYITISLSLRAGTLQTWGGLRWPPFFFCHFPVSSNEWVRPARPGWCWGSPVLSGRLPPSKMPQGRTWQSHNQPQEIPMRSGWQQGPFPWALLDGLGMMTKLLVRCWVGVLSNAIPQGWGALFQIAEGFFKIESDSTFEVPRIIG